jgi:hypothetical protein
LFIERLESIKNEMREKIYFLKESSDVTVLKFSTSDFINKLIWRDKNEFEFNGKMYDVIRIDENENEYTVYCLNDVKEEILVSNFKKLNDEKGGQKNCITVKHNNFVMYAIQISNPYRNRYYSSFSQVLPETPNYNQVSIDVLTPPPRISL